MVFCADWLNESNEEWERQNALWEARDRMFKKFKEIQTDEEAMESMARWHRQQKGEQ